MSAETFKPYLVRDKVFLEQLYESQSIPNSKRLILFAPDQKLDTLIKLLHLISNGQITMKKEHFNMFQKSQLKLIKKNFEGKKSVKEFLKKERKMKVTILQKLSPIMSHLLYPLFNES